MKKFLYILSLCGIVLLSGCGMTEDIAIKSNGNVDVSASMYYTQSEYYQLLNFNTDGKPLNLKKVERNGLTYYVDSLSSSDSKENADEIIKSAANSHRISFSSGNYAFYKDRSKDTKPSTSSYNEMQMFDFADLNITMPNSIYKTNADTVDGNKASWNLVKFNFKKERLYACDLYSYNQKKVELFGAKDREYLAKDKLLKVKTNGCIKNLKLDNKILDTNAFRLSKDGKHTIHYTLVNNAKGSFTVYLDTKAPSCNIKNTTYKRKVKISVSDKCSGVKKITLNGKTIQNGKNVSKKGTYTLKLYDKAGNSTMRKFKIK